jgi:hypothetical protein
LAGVEIEGIEIGLVIFVTITSPFCLFLMDGNFFGGRTAQLLWHGQVALRNDELLGLALVLVRWELKVTKEILRELEGLVLEEDEFISVEMLMDRPIFRAAQSGPTS